MNDSDMMPDDDMTSDDDMTPDDDMDPDDMMPKPSLLLGLNVEEAFTEFATGDSLEVHSGSQGGIHVFVSFRVDGVDNAESLLIRQHLTSVETGELVAPELEIPRSTFAQTDSGIEVLDYFVVLEGSLSDVVDELVDVELTVRDPNGSFEVTAVSTVTLVPAS